MSGPGRRSVEGRPTANGTQPKNGSENGRPGRNGAGGGRSGSSGAEDGRTVRHGTDSGSRERKGVGDRPGSHAYRTRIGAWVLLAAAFAGSVAAAATTGGAIPVFLSVVLGGVMLLSGAGPRMALSGIQAERALPAVPVRDGEQLPVRLKLSPAWPFPFVWLAVSEDIVNVSVPAEEGSLPVRISPIPIASRVMEWGYAIPVRRGVYRFSAVEVAAGDLFGLTAVRRTIPCPGEAAVWPALLRADSSSFAGMAVRKKDGSALRIVSIAPEAEPAEDAWRASARKLPGKGPDSRPYAAGDPVRAIDWRSAAKGRGLRTKVQGLEREADAVVVLDTSAEAYAGDSRLFDAAAAWAALMIDRAAAAGASVSLIAGGQSVSGSELRPPGGSSAPAIVRSGSFAGIEPLLQRLAEWKADGQGAILEPDGAWRSAAAAGGSVLVCITGEGQTDERLKELAGAMAGSGAELQACVVSREPEAWAKRERQRSMERFGIRWEWLSAEIAGGMPHTKGGA